MKKIVIPIAVLCGAALAVGAAVFLSTAEPYGSAEPSELVGSWHGSQGAELTLRKDGSLSAVKVPTDFSDSGDPIKPFTGKGTWELKAKSDFDDQEIDVSLGEVFGSKIGIYLQVKGKGARDGLAIPVSVDTAQRFAFKRDS
ncbi:hypothetical protein [Streptomyces olivoreticuli]|uniref:hypothetical protein n=1 Tax=Streptomyces olivoreticuli TaxID=68246 RepID=UPI000E23055B|nr:hypothetical protein [Streptomyces olivoreticuli]